MAKEAAVRALLIRARGAMRRLARGAALGLLLAGLGGAVAAPAWADPDKGAAAVDPDKDKKDNSGKRQEEPTLVAESHLRFGKLVIPETASITVPPSGLDVVYTGAIPLRGDVGAASFLITGRKNELVELYLPGTITASFGSKGRATVERITASADVRPVEVLGPTVMRFKLDRSGQARISVGGTLKIDRHGARGPLSVPVPIKVLSRGEQG